MASILPRPGGGSSHLSWEFRCRGSLARRDKTQECPRTALPSRREQLLAEDDVQ